MITKEEYVILADIYRSMSSMSGKSKKTQKDIQKFMNSLIELVCKEQAK